MLLRPAAVGAIPQPSSPVTAAAPYTCFSTDWRTGALRDELPMRGVSFNCPLNKAGDFTGTYTVPRGGAALRASVAPKVSGLRVYRGSVPVWDGYVWAERQTGPRDFEVSASEWGSFFEQVILDEAALGDTTQAWYYTDDHTLVYDLLDMAQSHDPGWNASITWHPTLGGVRSDLTVNSWDLSNVADLIQGLSDAQGGPDYAFYPLADGTRFLALGTPLGRQSVDDSGVLLEYVEDTGLAPVAQAWPPSGVDPAQSAAGSGIGRGHGSGGNVIVTPTLERDGTASATEQWSSGAGEEVAKLLGHTVAQKLIDAGWPRSAAVSSYQDVSIQDTLDRHAEADLAAAAGLKVTVSATTYGNAPDWTQVQRGDAARFSYDSDLFDPRPYVLDSRILDIAVKPDDDGGPEQVTYTLASVQRID